MFAVLAFCATVAAQALPLTTVYQDEQRHYGFETSTDGTNHYITIREIVNIVPDEKDSEIEKGDVVYTLYDNNFKVMEQFTIKGGYETAKHDGSIYKKYNPAAFDVLGYDLPYIHATKGLFTNDGKWCVIIWERDPKAPYGVYSYAVYNQDGVKLGYLPEEKGYFGYAFGNGSYGRPFLIDSYSLSGDSKGSVTVYTFATEQSNVAAPSIVAKRVQVWPNPLPAGETVTIELNREAPAGTFITFSDMNGRLIDKARVQEGESTFIATPRSMRRGAYIYTVYFGDGDVVSGKLIAQ